MTDFKLEWTETPLVSDELLGKLEALVGMQIPEEYVENIKQNGGGWLEPEGLITTDQGVWTPEVIENPSEPGTLSYGNVSHFYSLDTLDTGVIGFLSDRSLELAGQLPIAADNTGNAYCLALNSPERGSVKLWIDDSLEDESASLFVATTLTEFLMSIRQLDLHELLDGQDLDMLSQEIFSALVLENRKRLHSS